jgi:hypothetical protein
MGKGGSDVALAGEEEVEVEVESDDDEEEKGGRGESGEKSAAVPERGGSRSVDGLGQSIRS